MTAYVIARAEKCPGFPGEESGGADNSTDYPRALLIIMMTGYTRLNRQEK